MFLETNGLVGEAGNRSWHSCVENWGGTMGEGDKEPVAQGTVWYKRRYLGPAHLAQTDDQQESQRMTNIGSGPAMLRRG